MSRKIVRVEKLLYLLALGRSEQRNTIESMKDTVKYRYEDGKLVVPLHPQKIFQMF